MAMNGLLYLASELEKSKELLQRFLWQGNTELVPDVQDLLLQASATHREL